MYATINFKSKKALKEAVASGKKIRIYQPNEIITNPKATPNYTGPAALEGPWYPAPHSWYASVRLVNGVVIKVS